MPADSDPDRLVGGAGDDVQVGGYAPLGDTADDPQEVPLAAANTAALDALLAREGMATDGPKFGSICLARPPQADPCRGVWRAPLRPALHL
jgi:hypothetical protein